MTKAAIVLTVVVLSLVTLTVSATYAFSINQSDPEAQADIPTATPMFTFTPFPQPTASPTSTSSPTPTPQLNIAELLKADPSIILTPWSYNASLNSNEPSIVAIISPEDGTIYPSREVNLTVNVGTNIAYIHRVTYKADWMDNNKTLFFHLQGYLFTKGMSMTTILENVPAGNRTITVTASIEDGTNGRNFSASVASSVNFTVQLPYPPATKLTLQQVQETINYFESEGLKIQVLDGNKPQNWLNMGVINFETKEDLADFATAHGITVLDEFVDSEYVSFCAYVYNNSPLPTIYSFSATIH